MTEASHKTGQALRHFFFLLGAAWVRSRAERPSVSEVSGQLRVQFGCKLSSKLTQKRIKQSKQQIRSTNSKLKCREVQWDQGYSQIKVDREDSSQQYRHRRGVIGYIPVTRWHKARVQSAWSRCHWVNTRDFFFSSDAALLKTVAVMFLQTLGQKEAGNYSPVPQSKTKQAPTKAKTKQHTNQGSGCSKHDVKRVAKYDVRQPANSLFKSPHTLRCSLPENTIAKIVNPDPAQLSTNNSQWRATFIIIDTNHQSMCNHIRSTSTKIAPSCSHL